MSFAAKDPRAGARSSEKGFTTSVVEVDGRRMIIARARDGSELRMARFAAMPVPDAHYPADAPFVGNHAAWVGRDEYGPIVTWPARRLTGEIAAEAVTRSVAAGWDLDNAFNVGIPFFHVKLVSLRRGAMTRVVMIPRRGVMSSDKPTVVRA
jgi:hypothetical protein